MEKKPQVFPSKEQIDIANAEKLKTQNYQTEKAAAVNDIYVGPTTLEDTPEGHKDALTMMQEHTARQMEQKAKFGKVVESDYAEKTEEGNRFVAQNYNSQIELRDKQLEMNKQQTQNYQKLAEEASNRQIPEKKMQEPYVAPVQPSSPSSQPLVANNVSYGQPTPSVTPYILEISQPNYNSPFDVIPLPSLGKTYRNKKPNVRLGYMTTADENILTSPNLLQSGEFLNVLINRKILEPDLRYNDLLVGDRNAIMIWLRATGYGEMYPVTLLDENGDAFDTELNLNELKTKELGAEPDDEGLFDYTFKLARAQVKFKLLTCSDIDAIDAIVSREKENGVLIDNTTTYTLEKRIVEINGSRDKHTIKEFSNVIRVQDGKDFNKYLDMVEPGIDLNITVGTPGGGSVNTFLPLNISFFWPNFGV